MKRTYTGVNGRSVAIDLSKVEALLEEDEGEIHLFTASDWYRIRAQFADVERDWLSA
jgi:hypothetical protein